MILNGGYKQWRWRNEGSREEKESTERREGERGKVEGCERVMYILFAFVVWVCAFYVSLLLV